MALCFTISFLQWSCTAQPKELEIPNVEFNTPVKFIHPVYIVGALESNFYMVNYRAEYSGPTGEEESFIIKNYNNKVLKIRYSGYLNETLIWVKGFVSSDSGRACFIRWHNDTKKINNTGVVVTKSESLPGIKIDETTIFLETNIDATIIKKLYPKLKCKIINKNYEEIKMDCNKPVTNLEFFNNIQFVE